MLYSITTMFYAVFAGILAVVGATDHYYVQPDNMATCLKSRCPRLHVIIDYPYKYIKSNTTLHFSKGTYLHKSSDFVVMNVKNFSLSGTPNAHDAASPLSVIKCTPDHPIYFYNVSNLLIKYLKFEEYGSTPPRLSHIYIANKRLWTILLG